MIFAGLSGVMEFWARRSSSTSGVVDVWVSALTSMVLAGERESSARRSATSSVVVVVLELASMIFAGLSGVMESSARRSAMSPIVVDVAVVSMYMSKAFADSMAGVDSSEAARVAAPLALGL